MSDLEVFFNLVFDFWLGIICGAKPCPGLALFVNHKLGEVPLDAGTKESALFLFQKLPQGMSVGSVDIDLLEHVELDTITLGELLDLGVGSWLLSPKLVAGKGEDGQPILSLGKS